MDVEFHYYIMFLLALRAGFKVEEAYKIAYSSQYTDDNNIIYKVKLKDGVYRNYISQTLNILKPQRKLMRIYPVFHFVPGSRQEVFTIGIVRKDGKAHLLTTIENNENGLFLLRSALQSRDLFRIGIACHAYADTFAHQNFVGYYDAVNAMKGFPERLVPNIGHADAGRKPDICNLVWEDPRIRSDLNPINNIQRIFSASRLIYRELCIFTGKDPDDENVLLKEIKDAIGNPSLEPNGAHLRIAKYKDLIGDGFVPYDKDAWLKEAVNFGPFAFPLRVLNMLFGKWGFFTLTITVKGKDNFHDSKWFRFQEAVKNHQRIALDLLKPTFSLMDLPRL